MGIRAIEYRPWKGDRTPPNQRWLVISKHVFQKNVRAKSVIALLILGMMLAHAFPIIGAVFTPHEGITDEDMIGGEEDEEEEPDYTINTTGDVVITGDLRFSGNFTINGTISLNYQKVFPLENQTQEDVDRIQEEVNESMGKGRVDIHGSVNGSGSFGGAFGIASQYGFLYTNGSISVNGVLMMGQVPDLSENITDNGTPPGEIPPEFLELLAMMGLDHLIPYIFILEGATELGGSGTISGNGTISGIGTIDGWVESKEDTSIDFTGGQGYFSAIIIIFTMLLAAIICADVISADLANSSFVLYFSRPVRAFDYLLGKIIGLTWVMWLFCLIPPAVYVLVMLGTQTGDDYSDGFKILGKTLLVGLVTAFYFLPYGLMISSLTKSKAYAGIGIFMSFFVLLIISGIFSETSDKWSLISPVELLINFYKITYGGSIPDGITSGQVGGAILAFTVIPMAIVIFWIYRKGAGK